MKPLDAVADFSLISTAGCEDAIRHAIDLFVGPGRGWTDDDVATALTAAGHPVKDRTIASWRKRADNPADRRTPPSDALLKLCQIFGPAFTSKVIAAIGQGAHSLTALTGTPAEIIAALSEGTTAFAIRGIDGVYCNVDQGDLERVADHMIEILTPFSSKRGQ